MRCWFFRILFVGCRGTASAGPASPRGLGARGPTRLREQRMLARLTILNFDKAVEQLELFFIVEPFWRTAWMVRIQFHPFAM